MNGCDVLLLLLCLHRHVSQACNARHQRQRAGALQAVVALMTGARGEDAASEALVSRPAQEPAACRYLSYILLQVCGVRNAPVMS